MLRFLLLALLLLSTSLKTASAHLLGTAYWVDVPSTSPQDYGVYHFRRTFQLPSTPAHLVVHVSGDNRYQLFVNGQRVSIGPARGDLTHWRYETVDIAPQLHAGANTLAAAVWNDGELRAVAQVSNQTGFLLEADRPQDATVNTGRSWLCSVDKAYSPQALPADQRVSYYALGANERVDASLYPQGWEQPSFDDSAWMQAHEISRAAERDARDAPNRWMLVEGEIPREEQTAEQPLKLRKFSGIRTASFPSQPLQIPANTAASLLFDQTYLTTAYPELTVSGGAGASVRLRYAEALYLPRASRSQPTNKGNRNDIEGKEFIGPFDTYVADGGTHRIYRPLFWRTYRYLQIEIQTGKQPLTLEKLTGTFTAYPFQRSANLTVSNGAVNTDIQRILSTGWRTARLCAHETYMDCPFYEQLQYGGDARIQMLVSLYMTGDSRLMKNGIALLNSSRTAEGATYSRAPSALQQYIPPFSLWWIGMVHDYWMYVDDPAFVRQMLPGVRAVLSFYASYQKASGSLNHMPWWNFVDWVKQWPTGEPPADPDGSSAAALDLQLLLGYQWAAELEDAQGSKALADEYRGSASQLQAAVQQLDWDAQRGLYADQPSHQTYSQQVNTLAVLAHVAQGTQARAVVEKVFSDPTLAQSSIYFRAYTNAALREVGLGSRYLEELGPWHEMLGQGLTTWSEVSGPDTRSDCHAWGASPNFELLRTVAGIESAAPGFSRVHIAPNLGLLKEIRAEMPHSKGSIRVHITQKMENDKPTGNYDADIELPPGVTGDFEWLGASKALKAGTVHLPGRS